jgi:hypothetical protein
LRLREPSAQPDTAVQLCLHVGVRDAAEVCQI